MYVRSDFLVAAAENDKGVGKKGTKWEKAYLLPAVPNVYRVLIVRYSHMKGHVFFALLLLLRLLPIRSLNVRELLRWYIRRVSLRTVQ